MMVRRLVTIRERHIWAFQRLGLSFPLFEGDDGAIYAPVRPVCTQIGVNVNHQLERIRTNKRISAGSVEMPEVTAGGKQKLLCLRVDECAWWLATMDPDSKMRPDVRVLLDEIVDALVAYAGALLTGRAPLPALPSPSPVAATVVAVSSHDVVILACDCGKRWRVTVVNGEATVELEK